jgi:hypothetical protein
MNEVRKSKELKDYLYTKFTGEDAETIFEDYTNCLAKMVGEQKNLLSPNQYKVATKRILGQIAFYISVQKYVKEEKALEYAKEYSYAKMAGAKKMMKLIGKHHFGCAIFRKFFITGLKADTWVSEIKKDAGGDLIFDITKCLYKDLCDYYKAAKLCALFCDGDWLVLGHMDKLAFNRNYTLGMGDDRCDFIFSRRP